MYQHRASARQRTLKFATIAIARGADVDCIVRDISDTGACLEIDSPIGIPNDFTLVINKDGARRPCRIAWRSELRIGVRFDDLSGGTTETDIKENQCRSWLPRTTLRIAVGVVLGAEAIVYWAELSAVAHISQIKLALGLP
jgi:hypothetical protein